MHRLIFFLTAITFATLLTRIQFAQEVVSGTAEHLPPIPARLLHEFHNEVDELIAAGQFVKLDGATVTIRKADYGLSTLKMKEISGEDKRWVNKQVAAEKKNERLSQEAGQVWLTVNKAKPRTVVKACKRLKSFGRAAIQQAPKVRASFNIDDKRAKLACLSTYPYICKLDFRSLKEIVGVMNANRNGERDAVAESPQPFLDGIASMDYLGLLYLRHVAFTCELKAQGGWAENEQEPIQLKFSKGPGNSLRLAAITAIGEIQGDEATSVLLSLAPLVEAPINGIHDAEMLSALLRSFGKTGVNNGEVLAILQRHQQDFPKITAKSLKQIGEN